MKTYYPNICELLELIKKEIARTAASVYSDDGTTLYDAIIYTSRDEDTILEMINDAQSMLVAKFSDIASISGDFMEFNIPDERTHDNTTIGPVINRFIVMNVCHTWMNQKYKPKAEEYGVRSSDALNKIDKLLYEKLPPIPPTHIDN